MRCDEIREHIIEFVYEEGGAPPANPEIREHLRACPACCRELEELKQTRGYLRLWKDESPLSSVAIAGTETASHRKSGWRYARYAAIAAMAVICLLALANTRVTWDRNGFSFNTRLFAGQDSRDYYTKTEVRDLLKAALDDSEFRMNETNYSMMQKLLDTVEQDRWMDARLSRGRTASNRDGN